MKAVFTICSPAYFAQAKTLFQSVKQFNSDYRLFLCIFNLDGHETGDYFNLPDLTIINIEKLGIAEYIKMRNQYNSFELSCALKPFLANHILQTYNTGLLVYFDSDILITGALTIVEEKLVSSEILITPHCNFLTAKGEDFLQKTNRLLIERGCLAVGIYNGGFWAVKNTSAALSFLNWWQNALVDGAYNDPSHGLYTDQLWLNIAPVYFNETLCVLKHPGYNMAYWNLHERYLHTTGKNYIVNNVAPLIFFHFSGYKPGADNISVFSEVYTFENRPELKTLFSAYNKALLQNDHATWSQIKIALDDRINKRRKYKRYLKKLKVVK